jgi:hypothetical protein
VDFSVTDEEGRCLFIGGHGTLTGNIAVHIEVEVEPGHDDRIELVELLHRNRTVANWAACDTCRGGARLVVDYQPFGFDSTGRTAVLDLDEPRYLYLRIRHNGADPCLPSNLANARGPWVWTTPIWFEEERR